MTQQAKEWQKFLDLHLSGNKKEALSFAKKMKDAKNKASAMRFLKPNSNQLAESKDRINQLNSKKFEKSVNAQINKMVSHPGFMSNGGLD